MSDCQCDGRCCAVFYYTRSHEEVKIERGGYKDDPYIADMLVPLDLVAAAERGERFGVKFNDAYKPELIKDNMFTCRHWDEETKLCGAYEDRPRMCRDYPYGGTCQHGCGYELEEPRQEAYIQRNIELAIVICEGEPSK